MRSLPAQKSHRKALQPLCQAQLTPPVTHTGTEWIERFYQVLKKNQKNYYFFFYTCTLQNICSWDLHPGVTELIIKNNKTKQQEIWLIQQPTGRKKHRHFSGIPEAGICTGRCQDGRGPGSGPTPTASLQSPASSVYFAGVKNKPDRSMAFCSHVWGFSSFFLLSKQSFTAETPLV